MFIQKISGFFPYRKEEKSNLNICLSILYIIMIFIPGDVVVFFWLVTQSQVCSHMMIMICCIYKDAFIRHNENDDDEDER